MRKLAITTNKKIFFAAGVAMPPYSGTIKIKPSDMFKLSDIEFHVCPQTPLPFFLSGDQSGNDALAKSKENISKRGSNFNKYV